MPLLAPRKQTKPPKKRIKPPKKRTKQLKKHTKQPKKSNTRSRAARKGTKAAAPYRADVRDMRCGGLYTAQGFKSVRSAVFAGHEAAFHDARIKIVRAAKRAAALM